MTTIEKVRFFAKDKIDKLASNLQFWKNDKLIRKTSNKVYYTF